MKKYSLLLFLAILFISCDKDDICLEEKTPNLIIRFYDFETNELKDIEKMDVWAQAKDSVYTSSTGDSISIPLDLNNDLTVYNFRTNEEVEQVNFTYIRDEIFLSRSCGYKINFEEFQAIQNTSLWIKNIEIITNSINNEEAAHIHIFH